MRSVARYEDVRLALQALRREADLSEYELAKAMHLNKSTVYRIEDVDSRPDYEPSIGTIEKWLDCTSGETLTTFFFRVEYGPTHQNDFRLFARLRVIVREYIAQVDTLEQKVRDLGLPKTEKSFLIGLQRRLDAIAGNPARSAASSSPAKPAAEHLRQRSMLAAHHDRNPHPAAPFRPRPVEAHHLTQGQGADKWASRCAPARSDSRPTRHHRRHGDAPAQNLPGRLAVLLAGPAERVRRRHLARIPIRVRRERSR
jgi:transcriptional regulator with XRE-family HTH domain